MTTLGWIVLLSMLMSAISLVGSITLVLKPATLDRLLLPLVAFAAGSLIGGMFVAASFLTDFQPGIIAWLSAAAHEVPQELGDFAVLVHGGWPKSRALLFNAVSALTFPAGALAACAAASHLQVTFLIPFAAGNFLYIGAADLIPEIKVGHNLKTNLVHYFAFLAGLILLLVLRVCLDHEP